MSRVCTLSFFKRLAARRFAWIIFTGVVTVCLKLGGGCVNINVVLEPEVLHKMASRHGLPVRGVVLEKTHSSSHEEHKELAHLLWQHAWANLNIFSSSVIIIIRSPYFRASFSASAMYPLLERAWTIVAHVLCLSRVFLSHQSKTALLRLSTVWWSCWISSSTLEGTFRWSPKLNHWDTS